uniref:Aminotransferase class I and II n=1 Tax=Megaviridae environmental sample TaxID=1737588 RepID=A0A5J6VJY9_9VIRU|nr:MAG: aminotransferase class I and II [Megaviridae environmental sample]
MYYQTMIRYGQYVVPLARQCVNFKVGQPSPKLLPLNLIRHASITKFKENDPLLLQYGDIPGYSEFRHSLAKFLSTNYKREVPMDNLFVTSGISSALSLLCSLFLQPHDVIFVETPTYFLAKKIFQDHNIKCVGINMQSDGIDIQDLKEKLKQYNPKFMYMIPTAQNPTGITTSIDKRNQIIELSSMYGFKIIADEVYHMLTFPHIDAPPSMCELGKYNVISLGSFSKILAPALRLGWMEIPCKKTYACIKECGQLDSSGGMNPVISSLVHVLLDNNMQQEHLNDVKNILWCRAKVLIDAIEEYLVPLGCEYNIPQGGYFIFVKLPVHLDVQADVDYLQFGDWIRLSFSYYDEEELIEGVKRIHKHINEYHD